MMILKPFLQPLQLENKEGLPPAVLELAENQEPVEKEKTAENNQAVENQ